MAPVWKGSLELLVGEAASLSLSYTTKFTKFSKGNTSYLSLKCGSWQDSDTFQLRSPCVSSETVVGPGVILKALVYLCSWCLHWIVWPWARTARVLQHHPSMGPLCTEGWTERIREGEEREHPGGVPGLCWSSLTSDTPSGQYYFVNWGCHKDLLRFKERNQSMKGVWGENLSAFPQPPPGITPFSSGYRKAAAFS